MSLRKRVYSANQEQKANTELCPMPTNYSEAAIVSALWGGESTLCTHDSQMAAKNIHCSIPCSFLLIIYPGAL
jgi:hypothetical protein